MLDLLGRDRPYPALLLEKAGDMRGELTAGLGWGDKCQPVTTRQAVPEAPCGTSHLPPEAPTQAGYGEVKAEGLQ